MMTPETITKIGNARARARKYLQDPNSFGDIAVLIGLLDAILVVVEEIAEKQK